jgi:hypothetical protein
MWEVTIGGREGNGCEEGVHAPPLVVAEAQADETEPLPLRAPRFLLFWFEADLECVLSVSASTPTSSSAS